MSKYTEYSFDELIEEFARMEKNAFEVVQKLSETVTTKQDKVTVSLDDASGETNNYEVLSYNYFKQKIDNLDNTIQKMLGFNNSEAYIRMPDGTYQKIYSYRINKEPDLIGEISVPDGFGVENNWFFEDMLNPALFVNVDLSNYLSLSSTRIRIKRVILKTETDEQNDYFDENFKGKNNIEYDTLLNELESQNIQFIEDEENKDLPLSTLRYTGNFTIIKAENNPTLSQAVSTINESGTASTSGLGVTNDITQRAYLLNKLTYTDTISGIENGKTLAIGDKLSVKNSIFEIVAIDSSTNYVRLKRITGYDNLPIAQLDAIEIYSEAVSPKTASIRVGYDERTVVFFKAISDTFNITNKEWSPGIAFYSNELLIYTENGEITLKEFYFNNVADFGKILLSSATERFIPAIEGIKPDAPLIISEQFEVVKINEHKLNQKVLEDVRKKGATKNKLSSEIKQLESSIEKKSEQLVTESFNNEKEKKAVSNDLQSLITEKTSKSSLYSSIVKELSTVAENNPEVLDNTKYRIRGFFDIPKPKTSINTLPQNVVQFNIRYRYLKVDGNTSDAKQYEFKNDLEQVKRASFSPWIELKSKLRRRFFDENLGYYVWETENVEDSDIININQVDVPITKGEKVQIQIQSISEAGWPLNPITSDWSEIVTIEFPEKFSTRDESEIILEDSVLEKNRVDFEQTLSAKGVDLHLSSSAIKGENYWPHTLDVIASGFFTTEGNIISAYEYIKTLKTEIEDLRRLIEQEEGEMEVYLIDDDSGEKLIIKNNAIVDLFAGYYEDYLESLSASERKGAIITKTYTLGIKNSGGSVLQLVSEFPGGLSEDLPDSSIGSLIRNFNYDKRKYDIVPIMYNNINPDETKNDKKIFSTNHASSQLMSQFIYSRYKNVGLKTDLYVEKTDADRCFVPILLPTSGTPQSFIWNFLYNTSGTPLFNGPVTEFCIHSDFPYFDDMRINQLEDNSAIYTSRNSTFDKLIKPDIDYDNNEITSDLAYSYFKHSYGFNLKARQANGKKQLQYKFNNIVIPTGTGTLTLESYEYPDKFGFFDYDRYLIGCQTCGCYLTLAPQKIDVHLVDGTDYRATKDIKKGDEYSIEIPIIYQFRMVDYYGNTSNDGILGGWREDGNYPTNLTYEKTIGLDIFEKNKSVFSFDIKVTSKYKKETLLEKVKTSKTANTVSNNIQNLSISKNNINSL